MKRTINNKYDQLMQEGITDWFKNAATAVGNKVSAYNQNRDINRSAYAGIPAVNAAAKRTTINNFITMTYANLASAIKSGRVDPSLRTSDTPSTANTPTSTPDTSQAMNLDTYAKNQQAARAKAIKSQQTAIADMDKTAKANATNATADSELAKKAAEANAKPLFQQNNFDKKLIQQAKERGLIKESRYKQINELFESIITVLGEDNGVQSISDYMMDWIPQYTKVNNITSVPLIKKLAIEFEKTYDPKQKQNVALTKLAHALYNEMISPSKRPSTDVQDAPKQKQKTEPKKPDQNVEKLTQQAIDILKNINNVDHEAYKKLMHQIASVDAGGNK